MMPHTESGGKSASKKAVSLIAKHYPPASIFFRRLDLAERHRWLRTVNASDLPLRAKVVASELMMALNSDNGALHPSLEAMQKCLGQSVSYQMVSDGIGDLRKAKFLLTHRMTKSGQTGINLYRLIWPDEEQPKGVMQLAFCGRPGRAHKSVGTTGDKSVETNSDKSLETTGHKSVETNLEQVIPEQAMEQGQDRLSLERESLRLALASLAPAGRETYFDEKRLEEELLAVLERPLDGNVVDFPRRDAVGDLPPAGSAPGVLPTSLTDGVPKYLDQLIGALLPEDLSTLSEGVTGDPGLFPLLVAHRMAGVCTSRIMNMPPEDRRRAIEFIRHCSTAWAA